MTAASPGAERALTVLETLVDADDHLTLSTLSRRSGIPLATCAAVVYTLEQRGYAARRVVGRSHFWEPTLQLYGLATQLIRRVDLSSVARRELRELSDLVGMPVHIGVLTGTSVVCVAKAGSRGFIQFDTYPGKVTSFNLTALGKAIVAHLSEEQVLQLLGQLAPDPCPGARAIDPGLFLRELDVTRRRGYAYEDQEERLNVSCLAVPFFDSTSQVAGAVGVTGFACELSGRRHEVAQCLSDLASLISSLLGSD